MRLNRVVITGMGAVSPYGLGAPKLFEGIWEKKNCIRIMEQWRSIGGLGSFLAAPVPELDLKKLLPRSERRTMGKMAAYSTLAAREAVADSGLTPDILSSGSVGVSISSTTGSPEAYESLYEQFLPERRIETFTSGMFFKIMGHSCSANVMQALSIRGEQWAPTSACTSSAQAIGLGYLLVGTGRQRAMLCGGADEVHHSVTSFFDVLQAASRKNDTPHKTPAPFDDDRDGVVCGGGSGVMVLESLESALSRNAHIYAEIIGFGNGGDPGHIAHPSTAAMASAMEQALREAGITGADVDYVNAHATGTIQGDRAEAAAIGQAVSPTTPVASLKGHLGHTLGAAGILESMVCLEMMRRGELLPTNNLARIDPECRACSILDRVLRKIPNIILKNSFALGGVNTAIVYKRFE